MNYVKMGDNFCFNNAEKYSESEWIHYMNYPLTWKKHICACIEESKLICAINKNAFNLDGTPCKEELLAIWLPKDLDQTDTLNFFHTISSGLAESYKNHLIKEKNIPKDFFDHNICYFGCEEEYDL